MHRIKKGNKSVNDKIENEESCLIFEMKSMLELLNPINRACIFVYLQILLRDKTKINWKK